MTGPTGLIFIMRLSTTSRAEQGSLHEAVNAAGGSTGGYRVGDVVGGN